MAYSESDLISNDSDVDAVLIDRDDVSNYNPEQILPESPEVIQSIRTWLQPTSYDFVGGEYRKHLASHVAGTGNWLTSNKTYQQWLQSDEHGLLWIKGIPGSGKSVMAANLIHEIAQSNPSCPVLFFFFRQIIEANHEPEALLRDWLDQVLDYSPPLQKQLRTYVDGGKSIDSLSMDDLFKDLRLAFAGLPGKVFCVADALDEMDQGHDVFLKTLAALGQWRPGKAKVLITSRPVPRVEVPLRKAPFLHIRLEENLVDVDIATFVHYTLARSTIPETEWKVITDAVPGRANGLFLYAKLAMDAFLEPGADVQDVLSQLPADLNILYTGLLKEHSRRSGVPPNVQKLILESVTHATRPLRLLELAEMIKANTHDDPSRDLKATKDLIRAACGPLLEILPDETVSVIHHSFTEYLKGATRSNDSSGYPILKMGPTHSQLALACLNYLQAGCLDAIELSDTVSVDSDYDDYDDYNDFRNHGVVPRQEIRLRLNHPFFDYAATHWSHHINRSEAAGEDQTEISSKIGQFLGDERNLRAWLLVRWSDRNRQARGITQLHVAAKVGLTSYTKDLLKTIDVDLCDLCGRTPLWWAASEGHAGVIRLLIAAGADPNHDEMIRGIRPLHGAANKNHHEAVEALLQAGVDPLTEKAKEDPGIRCGNAGTTRGQTPLMYACQGGHAESVEVFLRFIKDLDTVHRALAWAAGAGRSKVVAKILEFPGVDVNAKVRGSTPLFKACGHGDPATIKILLEAGADPSIRCDDYGDEFAGMGRMYMSGSDGGVSCLYELCKAASKDYSKIMTFYDLRWIFTQFIEAGADINQRTPGGGTVLHSALGSLVLTKLLLDTGADANAIDDSGLAPLHKAQNEDIVALLIEEGHADIELRAANGQTPLLRILSTYHTNAIMKLLEYRPNCNAMDKEGNSSLHIALQQWSTKPEILKALLDAGADPNLKNHDGITPLLAMRKDSSTSDGLVDMLLDAGADINTTDRSGTTLLFRAIHGRSTGRAEPNADLKHLMDKRASPHVRDFKGRTVLHEAVMTYEAGNALTETANKRWSRFDFFVDLGLDIQAIDYRGNGLLHELALRRTSCDSYSGPKLVGFWERVVAMGLDLEQKNHDGRTPLHLLCAQTPNTARFEQGVTMPIDFVIGRIKNLDVADNEGITPLHIAVTQGQLCVSKLLDAGANPTVTTRKGLTPLHIAARCRDSNVVGMLLDSLRLLNGDKSSTFKKSSELRLSYTLPWGEEKPSPTVVPGVDAEAVTLSKLSCTPLFYAVRSGRPETVALLLEAGADIQAGRAFQACLTYEEEDIFWKESSHNQERSKAVLEMEDDWAEISMSRSCSHYAPNFSDDTTRLEEILDMLVRYGADPSMLDIHDWNSSGMDIIFEKRFDYTLRCFEEAWEKHKGSTSTAQGSRKEKFSELLNRRVKELSITTLRDSESVKPGQCNQEAFDRFLLRKDYHLVEEMARLGADFLTPPTSWLSCNLDGLVRCGLAGLLERVTTIQADSVLQQGDWHAFGDKTRPGLWFAKRDIENIKNDGPNPESFLLKAVQRELPNMDVVRLLVEKFAIDVNEIFYDHMYHDGENRTVPKDSVLHSLARGNAWWQVHQALPYLIKAGVDLNPRNQDEQTPLHMALEGDGNWPGPFHKDAARILIEAGADVNAVNARGYSCLASACYHADLVKLLKEHGAAVTADAILAAVNTSNIEALEELLSGGFDPNLRPEKSSMNTSRFTKRNRRQFKCSDDIEPQELYPLHYAASTMRVYANINPENTRETETCMQIVQVLLNHGADPFAKYLRLGTAEAGDTPSISVPDGNEECTILHQLLLDDRVIDPFLRLPSLDVNHRDAKGRTLLHAACRAKSGADRIIDAHKEKEKSTSLTVFQKLLSYGADLEARDNQNRNVLHWMIGHGQLPQHGNEFKFFEKSFTEVLEKAPHLVNQADSNGETPLHYAVRRAIPKRNAEIAKRLLEAGADPLLITKHGETVLHILARDLLATEIRTFFQDLAGRGVDINARNWRGETLLFQFCDRMKRPKWDFFSGNEEKASEEDAIPMLKDLGADFFARDDRGRGLLHVAATGDVERFQILMDMGLDVMLEDDAQQTAIDVAAASANQDVLELFEKKNK